MYGGQDEGRFCGATVGVSFSFRNAFDFATDSPFLETNINFNAETGGLPFQDFGDRSTTYGFYVQDDWKMSRNLTVNLGLRWDFSGNPTMRNGDMTNLQLSSGATLAEEIAGAKVIRVQHRFTNDRKGY